MNEEQNTMTQQNVAYDAAQPPQVQASPQPTEKSSGLSILGFVLSLIGLILTFSVIGMILGIPLMIAGFIIGIIALVNKHKKKILAIFAIILPVISPILAIIGGIFLAASLPRLGGIQNFWINESPKKQVLDVARHANLQELWIALDVYAMQNGSYPEAWNSVAELKKALINESQIASSIPTDPNKNEEAIKVGNQLGEKGNYTYALLSSGSQANWAYALVSKASLLENANATKTMVESWTPDTDVSSIQLWEQVVKGGNGDCSVENLEDLRFAILSR